VVILLRTLARDTAIVFQQNIVTDRVNKCAEPFRMNDLPSAQSHVKSGEGFLAHIFHSFPRMEPGAQFNLDQRSEVHAEMILGTEVARPQPLDVSFIKGVELQEVDPTDGKWQTV
jgi:hypothetical protein